MKFWSNSEIPSLNNHLPEKRLLAAVLQRAVTDYISGEGYLREIATAWLLSDEDLGAPFTFRFICEDLDLNVDNLRVAISAKGEKARIMDTGPAAHAVVAGAMVN